MEPLMTRSLMNQAIEPLDRTDPVCLLLYYKTDHRLITASEAGALQQMNLIIKSGIKSKMLMADLSKGVIYDDTRASYCFR